MKDGENAVHLHEVDEKNLDCSAGCHKGDTFYEGYLL